MLIGWAEERPLLLCLAAGAVANCFWLWRYRRRLSAPWYVIPVVSLAHTLLGVLSVRVFAWIESRGDPLGGGQSLFGGVLLLPLLLLLAARITKRRSADALDVLAVCTVTTLIFARVNCLIEGCCRGALLPGGSDNRWPTREVEICFHAALLYFMDRRVRNEAGRGAVWPWYMMAYGLFRFVEEWFRDAPRVIGPFHYGHLWAVLSTVIGSAVFLEMTERRRSVKRRR